MMAPREELTGEVRELLRDALWGAAAGLGDGGADELLERFIRQAEYNGLVCAAREPAGIVDGDRLGDITDPALAIHVAVNASMRGKRYVTTHVTGDARHGRCIGPAGPSRMGAATRPRGRRGRTHR